MTDELIPSNQVGKQLDLTSTIEKKSREEAEALYNKAAARLLLPGGWQQIAGWASAEFTAFDDSQQILSRPVKEGDYIRINIPGPGTSKGEGYDWVRVGLVSDETDKDYIAQYLGLRLDTSTDPFADDPGTAHFFEEGASSTLLIIRKGNTVQSSYHGRNERINNRTDKVLDNIRNTLTGAGALGGLSELQWNGLLKGLLSET